MYFLIVPIPANELKLMYCLVSSPEVHTPLHTLYISPLFYLTVLAQIFCSQ